MFLDEESFQFGEDGEIELRTSAADTPLGTMGIYIQIHDGKPIVLQVVGPATIVYLTPEGLAEIISALLICGTKAYSGFIEKYVNESGEDEGESSSPSDALPGVSGSDQAPSFLLS